MLLKFINPKTLVATVTVVVWEGEEQDTKSDNNSATTAENNTASNAINRFDCLLACSFFDVFGCFNHCTLCVKSC